MELIYFFAVASIAVLAAIGVIASRNTVHSALLVVVNLFCVAMLYLSLSAEFLAVVQITVYAGAIMVLFLFVITMLDTSRGETRNLLANRTPIAVGFALAFLVVVLAVLQPALTAGGAPVQASAGSNLQALGDEIFKSYVLPFELASLLLLVAMVAAMVLGKRRA